jgi:protoporphyrinogen oxidase
MQSNRRDFIKFVVAGSIAAGCPADLSLLALPTATKPTVDGEQNEICHRLRDGHHFSRPPVSARTDVVIVGGGMSGLAAAYYLQQIDFLLLEKENHWGGNAYSEDYDGQTYATGTAFVETQDSPAAQLAGEIGLELLPINNFDGSIIQGEFIADTWGEGLDHLPYPAKIRESFKKFRQEMLAIDAKKRQHELDNTPFSNFLLGYSPEVKLWWDTYGLSNWGALAEDTSATISIREMQGFASADRRDERSTLLGGLGAITRRLARLLDSPGRERLKKGATTVSVEPQKSEVHVTYIEEGRVKTVAAKAVIMATPKFITWRLIDDLPSAQKQAMKKLRYIPYPVVNLIFDKPVFNLGYDTWCPGISFTDMVVADWVLRNQPGYRQKHNILTCYAPLYENERHRLLTDDGCREIALNVLRDFQKLFRGSDVDPVEVHIYRRGHPMFVSTPGILSNVIPAASHPMERIFFANTDSEGPVSLSSGAITAARRCVRNVEQLLRG